MIISTLIKNRTPVDYHPSITSIWNFLQNSANKYGDKEAIIGIDIDTGTRTTITYERLAKLTVKTANLLLFHGIKNGDRFAILMENCPEILLFELAGGLIGATTVPLDIKRDTLDRKLFKLKNTAAKVLFARIPEITTEISQVTKLVKTITFPNSAEFFPLINSQSSRLHKPSVKNLNSLYLVLYTSGTTALPKGVPLTARALAANAEGIATWQYLTAQDRFNIILPLHHINSTTMSLATLLSGGTVILNSRYSASRFWNITAQEKCTVTSVVPTVIHDLLARKDEFFTESLDVSSLKRILVGSAPVLPEETLRFYKTFKIRVVQGYGQTETALRVTGVPVDLSEAAYVKTVKSNTIGTELKNCNITILKPDGTEAREKEEGEICIRGPVMAKCYWRNKTETATAFVNGWFHSGDLGYFKIQNGQKYFYIIGRLKEIIIKGGIKLSPALIEDALLKAFPEIDEASVVGFPDERMGEEVAAALVLKRDSVILNGVKDLAKRNHTDLDLLDISAPPQDDIIHRILESGQQNIIPGLSKYEVPKKIFIVNSLPKTSTGKIQRVEVKKMVAERIKTNKLENYYVRQILTNETEALKQALSVNNQRWQGLRATLNEFTARAKNGLLFGVFDYQNSLIGSLSCVRLSMKMVKQLKTWNEATANGTLANHDPHGDTVLCVAISVKSSSSEGDKSHSREVSPVIPGLRGNDNLHKLANQKINEYLELGYDHVIGFHRISKGTLPGATVWKILPHGRPEDKEAMGYNVLMKYPDISGSTNIISTKSSPSIALIEHALLYAKEKGIKNIIAFSRPAGFRNYVLKQSKLI